MKKVKLNGFYSNEFFYNVEPTEKNKGYVSMHIPTWNDDIQHALQTFFVGDFSEIKVIPNQNDGYTLTSKSNFQNNLLNGLQLYKHIEGILYSVYKKQYSYGLENQIQAPPSKILSVEIINE